MKKIGQGLSYTVYEDKNNRVLKKPTKNYYKFLKLLYWSLIHQKNLKLLNKYKLVILCGRESIETLRDNSAKIDLSIIGNPKFTNSLEYSQDKLIVLRQYFKTHSFKENCKVIDKYIENIFETWKNGFSDVDFNFAMNSGVTDKGKVILIDINALTFEKQEALDLIKEKAWFSKHSYKCLDDPKLKKYILKTFNKKLTKENLDKYWNNKIK